jgi:hypothetical protein
MLYEFELPLILKSDLFPEAATLLYLIIIMRPQVEPLQIIQILA